MPDPIKLPPGATLVSDGSQNSMPLPPGATLVSQQDNTPNPQPQQQPGFFQRLGESMGMPTSVDEAKQMVAHAYTHPWEYTPAVMVPRMIKNYAQNTAQGFKQGFKEANDADQERNAGQITTRQAIGKTASAALNSTVNAIPIIGPSIVKAGEDIAQKNYAGAAGGLTGVIGQVAAPEMPTKVSPNSAIGKLLMLGKTPEAAYESALKPSTTLGTAQRANMAQTGLREGIPVSQKGFEKLSGLIDDINSQIRGEIASDPNKPISTNPAIQNLQSAKAKFADQVNPRSDMSLIENAGQEFKDVYGDQIPAEQAQRIKQGTYRVLGDKAYGEVQGASREAQKALARGLKEELAQQFPELAQLNARDSRLIDLQDSLERAVGRIGNHQLIGIGTPIVTGATKALTGSGKLAAVAGVMKAVLDNPMVKSKLAIALSQGKVPSPFVMPKIAAYAGALQRLSPPRGLPFLPGSVQSPAPSDGQ